MKTFKGTYLLAFFVAALAAYAYFFEYKKKEEDEVKKQETSVIMPTKVEDIASIEIKKKDQVIKLKKEGSLWKLIEPVQDEADQNTVAEFVKNLTSEKSSSVATEGSVDWKIFGLDDPKATMTIQTSNGVSQNILISNKKNFQGEVFLRKPDQNKVLVGASAWHDMSDKTVRDLRLKRIFRKPLTDLQKIEFHSKEQNFSVVRDNDLWKWGEFPEKKLDAAKVREFLTSLTEVDANQFLVEGAGTPAQRKDWNLEKPDFNFKATFKDKSEWILHLNQQKDKTYIGAVSDPSLIVSILSGPAEKITQVVIDELRNLKEPFHFDKESVQLVRVQTPVKTNEFKKQGDQWVSAESPSLEIDPQRVSEFVEQVKELKVSFFNDRKRPLALKKTIYKVWLSDGKKDLLVLEWGDRFTSKAPNQKTEKPFMVLKSSVFAEPVAVEEALLTRLLDLKFVKEKTAPAPSPAEGSAPQ